MIYGAVLGIVLIVIGIVAIWYTFNTKTAIEFQVNNFLSGYHIVKNRKKVKKVKSKKTLKAVAEINTSSGKVEVFD
jgi:hypothetical protein